MTTTPVLDSSLDPSGSTPRADGFSMPARIDPHECSLLTWPPVEEQSGTDLEGFRDEVQAAIVAISRFEPVKVVVDPQDEADARKRFGHAAELLSIPVDACWLRDNGPIFLRDAKGNLAGVHFGFNGWGGRIECDKTCAMPRRVVEHLGARLYQTPFICEGGGISVDGEGTLITTEQVMRNDNRYSGMSRKDVERALNQFLGVETVIWLARGLVEDHGTDGHVDNVVEFAAPGVVLAQTVTDHSNPNYDLLQENLRRLKEARDAKGRKLDIIEMDVLPYQEKRGVLHVIPYTNAYVCNGAVIVPEVDPKLDETGWRILERAFPGREIVPIASIWQAVGGGGLGCITQQVPARRDSLS